MAAIVNGLVAVEAAGLRRDLLHLQRLRAAGHPALGPDGAAHASSSSRTTPWATAKTARPISRWSSSLSLRAIPGLVTLRPGDANEVVEAYRYIMQLRHEPAVLVLSRQPLPTLDRTQVRAGVRSRARRLRARRRARREARGDPHRDGQRGEPRRGGPREAASPRASARAWSRCRPGTSSSTSRRSTATACCRRT